MKTFLLANGIALLAAAAAGPAAAQTTRSLILEQVEVWHGDLDLATESGADAILTRLTEAASTACGGRSGPLHADPLGPAKKRAVRLCKVAAIDAATLTLDIPLVRSTWLGNAEAIRFGDKARRTRSDLRRLAGLDKLAAPPRNQ